MNINKLKMNLINRGKKMKKIELHLKKLKMI